MHLECDVLEHLLLLETFDALCPVDERLLEPRGLFGGQLEPFVHMLHVQHHGLVHVVVDRDDVAVLHGVGVVVGCLSHYITSANRRLFLRKMYTPNHSSSTVIAMGIIFTHQEPKVFQTVGCVAGAMKLWRMS